MVPLTILTGFLGAGKTTLLNRILRGDHGLRMAVMVNDFGAINIDAELIVGVEDDLLSLSNGCICCSLRDDLAAAARELLRRPDPPEYLVIEASGVSDPVKVALTFLQPEMRELVRIDSLITVVDAEHVRDTLVYERLIHDQITAADIIVLNKIDLVTDLDRASIQADIQRIAPRARVLPAVEADAPLNLLLDIGRTNMPRDIASDRADDDELGHRHGDHGAAFSTWHSETDLPLSLRAVQRHLKRLPTGVFRAKGVLYLADLPEARAIVQLVGKRLSVIPGAPWGNEQRRSRLVYIGVPGSVNPRELDLQGCAAVEQYTPLTQLIDQWPLTSSDAPSAV
jgi:G3E family GTPase